MTKVVQVRTDFTIKAIKKKKKLLKFRAAEKRLEAHIKNTV